MLLHKERNGSCRTVYLGNIKILSYTRKDSLSKFPFEFSNISDLWLYLDQYSNVNVELGCVNNSIVSNDAMITWQFWWQGVDSAPEIVKCCLNSVRRYAPGKVVVLDKENINEYIHLPSHIMDRVTEGVLPLTQFSDYVRASVLAQYGGLWLDATCYLSARIPQKILHSPFFIFSSVPWMMADTISPALFDVLSKKYSAPHHMGSSWFICSQKGHYAMKLMETLLYEYWRRERKLVDYFIFHDFLSHSFLTRPLLASYWRSMLKISNEYPSLLQSVLFTECDEMVVGEILKRSFVHKLTYKCIPLNVNSNSVFAKMLCKDNGFIRDE